MASTAIATGCKATDGSFESAVVSIVNDIIQSIDDGEVVPLVLLDLSAAFDTVDHGVLQEVLNNRFSVTDISLLWLRLYLTGKTQSISVNGQCCAAVGRQTA